MFGRRKSSKRNLKPFRRFDDVSMKSGISSYEWFIFIVLICMFFYIVYVTVKSFFE